MRVNPGKFARAAVIILILSMALAVAVSYAVIRYMGYDIVSNKVIEAKDAEISRNAKISEIEKKIDKYYLFEPDENAEMDAMSGALVDSLGDRYSIYMTPEEIKDWEDAVNSAFTGIGITFSVTDGRAEVLSVADDGPADVADIKSGDVILKVNDAEFETEEDFIRAISGKPGKTLKLGMLRGWFAFDADVTIGEVKMRAVTSRVINDDIGYIRITTFSKGSAEEFAAELKSLTARQVKSLIIDIRGNGGGYVDQCIDICDQLLPECTIGHLEDRKGKRETFNSDEESCGLPMAVLINEKSASASEIMAAAIKDNKAGTLVGMKTYGKGLSQTEYKMKDGSALKLTTARYLTPSGNVIDGKGVSPDKKVKKSDNEEEDGDVQLKKAVSILK